MRAIVRAFKYIYDRYSFRDHYDKIRSRFLVSYSGNVSVSIHIHVWYYWNCCNYWESFW